MADARRVPVVAARAVGLGAAPDAGDAVAVAPVGQRVPRGPPEARLLAVPHRQALLLSPPLPPEALAELSLPLSESWEPWP